MKISVENNPTVSIELDFYEASWLLYYLENSTGFDGNDIMRDRNPKNQLITSLSGIKHKFNNNC